MSSGLILLNKNGAAIAADSAVTIGDRTAIYNTARKIFEIGDSPVLVVITGSIGVLGVPIEVILKQFSIYARKHSLLKEKLSDYGTELMRFLEEKNKFFMFNDHEEDVFESYIYQVTDHFFSELSRNHKQNTNDEEIKKNIEKTYEDLLARMLKEDAWKLLDSTFQWSDCVKKFPKLLEKTYQALLENKMDRNFETSPMEELDLYTLPFLEKLCSKFTHIYRYFMDSELALTFGGYGEDQLYPAIFEMRVFGVVNGKLLYRINDDFMITSKYPRGIYFLAQKDVMDSIINGYNREISQNVHNHYLDLSKTILDAELKNHNLTPEAIEKITSTLADKLEEDVSWIDATNDYWNKSYRAVQHLPIQDLGKFAENLINIQSLKKQFTPDREYNSTVGGPTDVAIITKGDGIKWIKNSK